MIDIVFAWVILEGIGVAGLVFLLWWLTDALLFGHTNKVPKLRVKLVETTREPIERQAEEEAEEFYKSLFKSNE